MPPMNSRGTNIRTYHVAGVSKLVQVLKTLGLVRKSDSAAVLELR